MKTYTLFIIGFLFISNSLIAQSKYLTKTGSVTFEASVPSFEEVKAKNENTTAILNTETGEFAALVLVKGFRFKNALMEEHFNENYAESDSYPKAKFKGTISEFSMDKLSDNKSNHSYSGTLEFHGKFKTLDALPISISKTNGSIVLSGAFDVNVKDFDIAIPKIVSNKLSETVKVDFLFTLKAK